MPERTFLYDTDPPCDFEGSEVSDFLQVFERAGETAVTGQSVPGWRSQTVVLGSSWGRDWWQSGQTHVSGSDDDEKPSELFVVCDALDTVISYIDLSSVSNVQPQYEHFKTFREIIVRRQHPTGKQLFFSDLFSRLLLPLLSLGGQYLTHYSQWSIIPVTRVLFFMNFHI